MYQSPVGGSNDGLRSNAIARSEPNSVPAANAGKSGIRLDVVRNVCSSGALLTDPGPLIPNTVSPTAGSSFICSVSAAPAGMYAPSQYCRKSFEIAMQLFCWPTGSSASFWPVVWLDLHHGAPGTFWSGL